MVHSTRNSLGLWLSLDWHFLCVIQHARTIPLSTLVVSRRLENVAFNADRTYERGGRAPRAGRLTMNDMVVFNKAQYTETCCRRSNGADHSQIPNFANR